MKNACWLCSSFVQANAYAEVDKIELSVLFQFDGIKNIFLNLII